MRFRAQETDASRSATQGTMVRMAAESPAEMARPKVSRWFVTKKQAFAFVVRLETREPGRSLRIAAHRYGPRDARFVVTYFGSPSRPRVPLEPMRQIMRAGLVVDRRLPMVVAAAAAASAV